MAKVFIQNRGIRKSFIVALLLVSTAGLLTSCGTSKEEQALKKNCAVIYSNLKAIEDSPEIFDNSSVADSDSVALLLGQETRKEVEAKILAMFPFLDEIIVGRSKDKQYVDYYYYAGSIYLIKDALVGTDIKFPYTEAQMKAIATTDNAWKKKVWPLATKLFGDYLEPTNHQGCAVIDSEQENIDADINTSVAFSHASDLYVDYGSFLQAVRDCDVSGWHQGNKCAKNDYVSKPDNYKPSNELTQEEKDILAERERQSQSGGGSSSGTTPKSNVSAGQVCTSLGAVVNTENYGELTCKLVILGQVRAFLWMRS